MPLSAELIAERRASYEALAAEHGGRYYGWGAYADEYGAPEIKPEQNESSSST
jgi:regulator of RNase E activity RraB